MNHPHIHTIITREANNMPRTDSGYLLPGGVEVLVMSLETLMKYALEIEVEVEYACAF